MIAGIGSDIVAINRIKNSYNKFNDKFLSRFLTQSEIDLFENRKSPVEFLAGRWAAKEAVSKALGSGIGLLCDWHDIEVLPADNGTPLVTLSGKGKTLADSLQISEIKVTISHEKEYAVAFAIALQKGN